jgi:hypothetical protein
MTQNWIDELVNQAKANQGTVLGFGLHKPVIDKTKVAPKTAPVRPNHVPAKPSPKAVPEKKPKVAPYGKAANGKIAGYLKLGIKWGAADRDPETRKAMIQIIKAIKPIVWDRLSEDKRRELLKL